jgi:hypothetical protein
MATTEQLRKDIDRGRTRDKVAGSDPAMVPLGTDEEAAGTPLGPKEIEAARHQEVRAPFHEGASHGLGHAWILIGVVVALAAAALGWGALSL